MKKLIIMILTVISVITAISPSVSAAATSAYGLKNTKDTTQNAGTTKAVEEMTTMFYEIGDTIQVPLASLPDMEAGKTSTEKVVATYSEAARQSAYLPMAKEIKIGQNKDSITLVRVPFLNAKKEKAMMDELEKAADKIIAETITDTMTDYEKAMTIYEYIRGVSSYDHKAAEAALSPDYASKQGEWIMATSAYGCLIQKSAICQGYTQAYNLLARKAGLSSLLDTGDSGVLASHAWNSVKIGTEWYAIDCTYSMVFATRNEYVKTAGNGVTVK